MRRRGMNFLSLEVPGLAERRPSLVQGDFIVARYARNDARPYQVSSLSLAIEYFFSILIYFHSSQCVIVGVLTRRSGPNQ